LTIPSQHFTVCAVTADKKRYAMRTKISLKLNIVTCVIAAMVVFAFCGCTNEVHNNSGTNVVAISYVQYDFASRICGSAANVTMLSKPGGDVHGYEPSFGDIMKLAQADVLVYNGGESDKWVENLLESINNPSIRCVRLCDSVELLCNHDGHESGHGHGGEEHHHFDEHIHTSPKNAVLMVDAICRAMAEVDVSNKDFFEANAEKYISQIQKLDAELSELTSEAKNKKLIVADRFPFLYMARHYGFEYEALFAGCSQENDANPSVMIHLVNEVRAGNSDTVFYTELSNGQMADALCRETGAKKLMLHSCEGISREDFENRVSYVQLMKNNISNLREAIF